MANRLLYLVRHGEAEDLGTGLDDGVLTEVGKRQSMLIGERLRDTPFRAIHHSTLQRAVQTAELIADYLPDLPIYPSDLLRDCVPSVPDRDLLSPAHAEFLDSLPQSALTEGPDQAARAIDHYAITTGEDQRELIVTHNFLIGWFVRHALDAPSWRWMGLNQYNCALTIILYRPGRPSSLVSYNDVGHLPPSLRGLEHPAELRV